MMREQGSKRRQVLVSNEGINHLDKTEAELPLLLLGSSSGPGKQ